MQIVRVNLFVFVFVLSHKLTKESFWCWCWCSKFRSQSGAKNFESEEASTQENRERTPPVLSSSGSSRFVYEEAWEEDFDEHSQQ